MPQSTQNSVQAREDAQAKELQAKEAQAQEGEQTSNGESSQGKDINTTLKFLVLFICVIPILQKCFEFMSSDELVYFNILKMVIFFVIILVATAFWFIINYAFKNEKLRAFFEVSIMYIVCMLCYVSTGASSSNYKFIFALAILLYSIDFGIRFGIKFSVVAGLTVIACDMLTIEKALRSQFFQSDIVLLGAFCMTAYAVGYYAERDRQQIKTLSDAVNRDSLTGLYNHRYFFDFMSRALDTNIPGKQQYVMIMDIDFFKSYNDNLGHQQGDEALRKIAKICKDHFGDDHVFRYGGEEFSLYMEARDDEEAFELANELRADIERAHFDGQEMQPGHNLTVSIGVAPKKLDGETKDTVMDWIERADNSLYKAKAFRKNRVQMYSSVYERFDHLNEASADEKITSIRALLVLINSRDRYTYNHTDRVVHYCEAFAKYAKLSEEQSRSLLYSAYLHDIGKIKVDPEILISEKKLTDEQWEQMKRHPIDGADIVRTIEGFDEIALIVEQHHEKYNGYGYPKGLKGEEICYLARILSLADSFDAMTAKRPYQKTKTIEEAFAEINRCAGTQFDPHLARQVIEALQTSYL